MTVKNSTTFVVTILLSAVLLLAIAYYLFISPNGQSDQLQTSSQKTQHQNLSDRQLSKKPALKYSPLTLQPIKSTMGLEANIPYKTLATLIEQETNEKQQGAGEKQSCKRVLGAKVCATLLWEYTLWRDGIVEVAPGDDKLRLTVPISFEGVVSVDGRGGKLLGLRNKDITGKVELIADLDVLVSDDWCPTIDATISHRWISDPKIRMVGDLSINLRSSVDKAINKKRDELQTKLSKAIDCTEFKTTADSLWRVHTREIKSDKLEDVHLKVTPISAALSNTNFFEDRIGLAFALDANVEVVPETDAISANLALPPLTQQQNEPGIVELSLLINLPYKELDSAIQSKLTRFDADKLQVNSINVYPSGKSITVDLGFTSDMLRTSGNVYLSTTPIVDSTNNLIELTNIQLTELIDNKLLSLVTPLARKQLVAKIEEASIIDLNPTLKKLEQSVVDLLSDPARTSGIQIALTNPQIKLITINPEKDGLAAIVHVSTQLQATIPESVLIR